MPGAFLLGLDLGFLSFLAPPADDSSAGHDEADTERRLDEEER